MASTSKRSSSFNEDSNNDSKRAKSSQPVTGGSACPDNAPKAVVKDASTVLESKLEARALELRTESREGTKAIADGLSSSFNSLPTELLLLIIGYVDDFWDRHNLRTTSRRFHTLIPYPFTSSPPTHGDLLKLEQQLAHKIRIGCRQWMLCGECLRLRPTPKFSPSTDPRPGEMRVEFMKPWRICVDCGKRPLPEGYEVGDEKSTVKSRLGGIETREHYFPPGRWWMEVDGKEWVRCFVCREDREVVRKVGWRGVQSRCLECAEDWGVGAIEPGGR